MNILIGALLLLACFGLCSYGAAILWVLLDSAFKDDTAADISKPIVVFFAAFGVAYYMLKRIIFTFAPLYIACIISGIVIVIAASKIKPHLLGKR